MNNEKNQRPEYESNQEAWTKTGGEFASGPAPQKPSTPEKPAEQEKPASDSDSEKK